MNTQSDYSALRFWLDVGQYAIAVGVGIYVWLGNRFSAKTEEVKGVRVDVAAIANRVTKLESDLSHALCHEDLGSVHDRINDVAEQVAGLSGKMDGVKGAVEMIQEYLLTKGGHR